MTARMILKGWGPVKQSGLTWRGKQLTICDLSGDFGGPGESFIFLTDFPNTSSSEPLKVMVVCDIKKF